mmetsp:Transcript_40802/g.73050  ORF Transcript_40802/g.73050 Transcript_40802/m.73050 type:complete len:258 (+) Transcript_40802:277-1050(+)
MLAVSCHWRGRSFAKCFPGRQWGPRPRMWWQCWPSAVPTACQVAMGRAIWRPLRCSTPPTRATSSSQCPWQCGRSNILQTICCPFTPPGRCGARLLRRCGRPRLRFWRRCSATRPSQRVRMRRSARCASPSPPCPSPMPSSMERSAPNGSPGPRLGLPPVLGRPQRIPEVLLMRLPPSGSGMQAACACQASPRLQMLLIRPGPRASSSATGPRSKWQAITFGRSGLRRPLTRCGLRHSKRNSPNLCKARCLQSLSSG